MALSHKTTGNPITKRTTGDCTTRTALGTTFPLGNSTHAAHDGQPEVVTPEKPHRTSPDSTRVVVNRVGNVGWGVSVWNPLPGVNLQNGHRTNGTKHARVHQQTVPRVEQSYPFDHCHYLPTYCIQTGLGHTKSEISLSLMCQ